MLKSQFLESLSVQKKEKVTLWKEQPAETHRGVGAPSQRRYGPALLLVLALALGTPEMKLQHRSEEWAETTLQIFTTVISTPTS